MFRALSTALAGGRAAAGPTQPLGVVLRTFARRARRTSGKRPAGAAHEPLATRAANARRVRVENAKEIHKAVQGGDKAMGRILAYRCGVGLVGLNAAVLMAKVVPSFASAIDAHAVVRGKGLDAGKVWTLALAPFNDTHVGSFLFNSALFFAFVPTVAPLLSVPQFAALYMGSSVAGYAVAELYARVMLEPERSVFDICDRAQGPESGLGMLMGVHLAAFPFERILFPPFPGVIVAAYVATFYTVLSGIFGTTSGEPLSEPVFAVRSREAVRVATGTAIGLVFGFFLRRRLPYRPWYI